MKQVIEFFESHPTVDTVHETTNGFLFEGKNDADAHAGMLKEKAVKTHERAVVEAFVKATAPEPEKTAEELAAETAAAEKAKADEAAAKAAKADKPKTAKQLKDEAAAADKAAADQAKADEETAAAKAAAEGGKTVPLFPTEADAPAPETK